MTGSGYHEELGALQAELRRVSKADARQDRETAETHSPQVGYDAAQTDASVAALEEQMRELGTMLSDHAGGAGKFIAKHPLISVFTGFVLGIAIGRMMGRT